MRMDAYWNAKMRPARSEGCSLCLMLGRMVTRGQGPMKAVVKLEDAAAAYDMGNTRMGIAQEQDRLVWGEKVGAA